MDSADIIGRKGRIIHSLEPDLRTKAGILLIAALMRRFTAFGRVLFVAPGLRFTLKLTFSNLKESFNHLLANEALPVKNTRHVCKLSLLPTILLSLTLISCAHNQVAKGPGVEEIENGYAGDLQELPTVETDLDQATAAVLPKDINESVLKWIKYFNGKGRSHMERYLTRSTRYLPVMKEILKQEGLPEDLVYMALIESGFSASARSHAGAVGYWQFIRDTGRVYDLRITRLIDERQDPVKSTQAAARYLKGLYNLFGSWYLAIAAYNVGENRVKRVVMQNFTRDFWELARRKQLPRETIDYVPKYIAAKMIAHEPQKYGFVDLTFEPTLNYESLSCTQSVDLKKLAEEMKLSYDEVKVLNPSYRTQYAVVEKDLPVEVRVPFGTKTLAQNVLSQSYVAIDRVPTSISSRTRFSRHRVRRGETLASIASKFETSVEELRRANRMGRRAVVRKGMTLRVPVLATPKIVARSLDAKSSSGQVVGAELKDPSVHVVKRGETLSRIAKKYQVTIGDLTSANGITSHTRISVGKRLVIPD